MKFFVALCLSSLVITGVISSEADTVSVGEKIETILTKPQVVVPDANVDQKIVSSKSSASTVKLSDEDERHLKLLQEHEQYLHTKNMAFHRQAQEVAHDHRNALNVEKLGHHGHYYEREVHTQNLLIIPFETHKNAEKHMQHRFHERFLSHEALTDLHVCIESNYHNYLKPAETPVEKERLRLWSEASYSCRTPYEKCIDNALEPHYNTMEDKVNGSIPRLVIHNAAKHCDHLSSVGEKLLAKHRENYIAHYNGHGNTQGKGHRAPMKLRNPTLYHGLSPHPDFIEPFLHKMFPHHDYTSSELRHCMQYKLTHPEWHLEHGQSNPYSFQLASIHCHHDVHGFYERHQAHDSYVATNGYSMSSTPQIARPIHLTDAHKRYEKSEMRRRMAAL